MKIIKVGILCELDGFANSIRPMKIKKLLEREGYKVELIETGRTLDLLRYKSISDNPTRIKRINVKRTSKSIIKKRFSEFKKELYPKVLGIELKLRAKLIKRIIKYKDLDILICENGRDYFIINEKLSCLKILDLPAPFIDELFYAGNMSKKRLFRLREIEKRIYSNADLFSLHWHTYADYVKKNIYNGNNFIELNWGCDLKPKDKLAKFSNKPKIICLGGLGGYWVSLQLLSKLSKIYDIDVYGGPKPDKKWGLNYKGYAPNLDILSNYQFGLITITKDKLRKSSFSSKHLEYLSYGLPVLTPEWRKDSILDDVSIHYNEDNFLKKVKEFSKKDKWEKMSKKCYEKAKELNWEDNLKPLVNIINNYRKSKI